MRNKFKAALSISVIKRLGDQLRVLRLGRARLAPVSASLSQAEATTAINSGNDNLPFRPGVGIMLFNAAGEVWVGRRTPKWLANGAPPIWQMPQGGINPGEPPERAARRELEEETGIRNAEIVGEIPAWLTWELPDELLGIALKGRYVSAGLPCASRVPTAPSTFPAGAGKSASSMPGNGSRSTTWPNMLRPLNAIHIIRLYVNFSIWPADPRGRTSSFNFIICARCNLNDQCHTPDDSRIGRGTCGAFIERYWHLAYS
jgi:8-oxo-dGTP pyrophosphatase MutT (NUDIX family)